MVALDGKLVRDAHACTTEANAHAMTQLILAYEQAVELHNGGGRGDEGYSGKCERVLRHVVFEQRMIQLAERSATAAHEAALLIETSRRLQQLSDRLNERIEKVLGRLGG